MPNSQRYPLNLYLINGVEDKNAQLDKNLDKHGYQFHS